VGGGTPKGSLLVKKGSVTGFEQSRSRPPPRAMYTHNICYIIIMLYNVVRPVTIVI